MTTTLKTCAKCGATKDTEDFYVKDKATGRLSGKCKSCHMDDVRAYRVSHIDYFRAIDRRRAMLPHRVAAREQWEERCPERRDASNKVNNAIRYGKVKKLPCFICGCEKVEGHHPDYSRPLDVVWLCNKHHKEAHALHYYLTKKAA